MSNIGIKCAEFIRQSGISDEALLKHIHDVWDDGRRFTPGEKRDLAFYAGFWAGCLYSMKGEIELFRKHKLNHG